MWKWPLLVFLSLVAYHRIFLGTWEYLEGKQEDYDKLQWDSGVLSWVWRSVLVKGYYEPVTQSVRCLLHTYVTGVPVTPRALRVASWMLHLVNVSLAYYVALILLQHSVPIWLKDNQNKLVSARSVLIGTFYGCLLVAVHPFTVQVVAVPSHLSFLVSSLFALLSLLSYVVSEAHAVSWRRRAVWRLISLMTYVLASLAHASGLVVPLVLSVLRHYVLPRQSKPGDEEDTALSFVVATVCPQAEFFNTPLFPHYFLSCGLLYVLYVYAPGISLVVAWSRFSAVLEQYFSFADALWISITRAFIALYSGVTLFWGGKSGLFPFLVPTDGNQLVHEISLMSVYDKIDAAQAFPYPLATLSLSQHVLRMCASMGMYVLKFMWPTGLTSVIPLPQQVTMATCWVGTVVTVTIVVVSRRYKSTFPWLRTLVFVTLVCLLPSLLYTIDLAKIFMAERHAYVAMLLGVPLLCGGVVFPALCRSVESIRLLWADRGSESISVINEPPKRAGDSNIVSSSASASNDSSEAASNLRKRHKPKGKAASTVDAPANPPSTSNSTSNAPSPPSTLAQPDNIVRVGLYVALAIPVINYLIMTVPHVDTYRSNQSMWSHCVAQNPYIAECHARLAGFVTLDLAEVHAKSALLLDPRHPLANYNLGMLRSYEQKFDMSTSLYNASLAVNPFSVETLYRMGWDLFRGLNRSDLAEPYFVTALEFNPHHFNSLFGLALLYSNSSQFKDALEYYGRASVLEPNDTTVLINMGHAMFELKMYPDAVNVFRSVTLLDPENEVAENYMKLVIVTSMKDMGVDDPEKFNKIVSEDQKQAFVDRLGETLGFYGEDSNVTPMERINRLAERGKQPPRNPKPQHQWTKEDKAGRKKFYEMLSNVIEETKTLPNEKWKRPTTKDYERLMEQRQDIKKQEKRNENTAEKPKSPVSSKDKDSGVRRKHNTNAA